MNPKIAETPPLITMPNSLQAQMDRAQNLLGQSERAGLMGESDLSIVKAREGMRVLGRLADSSPDNATLLVAGEMGHRGYEFETQERVDSFQIVERKFLGIVVATDIVNLPTIRTRIHRGHLF